MKLEYIQMGEYQIPNLTLAQEEQIPLGKYGRMRRKYLKEHRPILFMKTCLSAAWSRFAESVCMNSWTA